MKNAKLPRPQLSLFRLSKPVLKLPGRVAWKVRVSQEILKRATLVVGAKDRIADVNYPKRQDRVNVYLSI